MIRSLAAVVFLALYTLLLGPPLILHAFLSGSIEWLYSLGVGGARMALRIAGIRIQATGLENIPPGVCIFVANHTSNLDPPVVVAAIPRRVALLGKKEVFRLPILGRAFRMASFVPVDRADRAAAVASLEEATRHLQRGTSYLVFPEGTRSPDGRLRAFKKGTFIMAIKAAVPVVPVSVTGAHALMPRGSLRIRRGDVQVHFHPPIDASGVALDEREILILQAHAAVASGLHQEQQPLEEPVSANVNNGL